MVQAAQVVVANVMEKAAAAEMVQTVEMVATVATAAQAVLSI